MAIQMEKPRIHVKTKNLQQLFDYCIESKTEFTVIPKNSNDTWEIELGIKSIMEAIKWGMYLKANKIDLVENPLLESTSNAITAIKSQANVVKTKSVKKNLKTEQAPDPLFNDKVETKENSTKEIIDEVEKSEEFTLLSFDGSKNQSQQNELF